MPRKRDEFRLSNSSILINIISQSRPGECPYSLFLGAGASIASGIDAAPQMIDRWRREVYYSLKTISEPLSSEQEQDYRSWLEIEYKEWLKDAKFYLNGDREYGTLFQCMGQTKTERQMIIEHLIDHKKPSPGYFFLAGLMQSQYFDRILTTNFDDLAAEALGYYGVKPVVCSFDSNVSSVNVGSIRPKIIKLHGDYLFDNLKNTDDETLNLGDNMEKKLVEMCEDRGLIVVGYSGEDESVMAPLFDNLRRNKKFLTGGLHWLIFRPPHAENNNYVPREELPERLVELADRFPDRVFFYSTSGFDRFFQSIFDALGPEKVQLPDGIVNPMKNNVAIDFVNACRDLAHIEGDLSAQMNQHREFALNRLSEMQFDPAIALQIAHARWQKGRYCEAEGEIEKAEALHQEAADIAHGIATDEQEIDLSTRLDAYSRRLGSTLALLRVKEQGAKNTNETLKTLKEYLGAEKNIVAHLKPQTATNSRASLAYNSLCTIGKLVAQKGLKRDEAEPLVASYVGVLLGDSIGTAKLDRGTKDPHLEAIKPMINKVAKQFKLKEPLIR